MEGKMTTKVSKSKTLSIPRSLPILCFAVVAIYLIFFTLEMLYEADVVSRNTPVPWEWLCGISLLAWVFAHSLILGREETGVE
jgi:hypothetical protein